jgi:excisionase family DNA binding protein
MADPDPVDAAVTDLAVALAALIAAVQTRRPTTVKRPQGRSAQLRGGPPPSATRALTPDALLTVPEAAAELRIGRTHLYKLIKLGQIRPVKLGARTLVPHREIQRFTAEQDRGD